jgi:hypothetical protein
MLLALLLMRIACAAAALPPVQLPPRSHLVHTHEVFAYHDASRERSEGGAWVRHVEEVYVSTYEDARHRPYAVISFVHRETVGEAPPPPPHGKRDFFESPPYTPFGCVAPIYPNGRWRNEHVQLFKLETAGAQTSASALPPLVDQGFEVWERLLLQHHVYGGVQQLGAGELLDLQGIGQTPLLFNSISWRPFVQGSSVLAFAALVYYFPHGTDNDGSIGECNVVFNEQRLWNYQANAPQSCSYFHWQRVAIHEFGHCYGLADEFKLQCANEQAIMYGFVNPCSDRTLAAPTDADQCALRTLYDETPCVLPQFSSDIGLDKLGAPSPGTSGAAHTRVAPPFLVLLGGVAAVLTVSGLLNFLLLSFFLSN